MPFNPRLLSDLCLFPLACMQVLPAEKMFEDSEFWAECEEEEEEGPDEGHKLEDDEENGGVVTTA